MARSSNDKNVDAARFVASKSANYVLHLIGSGVTGERLRRAQAAADRDAAALAALGGTIRRGTFPSENPPRGGRAQRVISILEKSAMTAPPVPILSPAHLVHYSLYEYIGRRSSEVFLAVYLNVRNIMIGFTEYTMGSAHEVSVTPAGVFQDALLAGAAAIITVHQHPTGIAQPSDADEMLWERMRQLGKLMGVPVIDNLILGEDDFYSEEENTRTSYAKLRIMMK